MAGFLDTSWLFDEKSRTFYLGKHVIKFGFVVIFIIYFIFLFTLSINDSNILSSSHVVLYMIGVILPLMIFCFFLFSKMRDPKYLILFAIFGVIIFFLLLRNFLPSFSNVFSSFSTFFTEVTPLPNISHEYSFVIMMLFKLLFISIILIGLALVYNVFLNEGYRQPETAGFVMYCIFFIPCLIDDYFAYLFQEFKNTPVVVYVLIGLELLLLFAYILLPKLLNKFTFMEGKVLITNPTYFYHKQMISNITPFYKHNTDMFSNEFNGSKGDVDDLTKKTVGREYAISMWMTTNNPTFGKEDCMMFRFGSDSKPTVGCPYISCTKEGKWRFVLSNNTDTDAKKRKVTTDLVVPMQRWNYVVLNYHHDEVDLFINGVLMETIHLDKSVLPNYDNTMDISIGSDTNELHGAICNLTVFPKILNITQISQSYNILRLQNPPLNNLR
jgi:hypothetical protein